MCVWFIYNLLYVLEKSNVGIGDCCVLGYWCMSAWRMPKGCWDGHAWETMREIWQPHRSRIKKHKKSVWLSFWYVKQYSTWFPLRRVFAPVFSAYNVDRLVSNSSPKHAAASVNRFITSGGWKGGFVSSHSLFCVCPSMFFLLSSAKDGLPFRFHVPPNILFTKKPSVIRQTPTAHPRVSKCIRFF